MCARAPLGRLPGPERPRRDRALTCEQGGGTGTSGGRTDPGIDVLHEGVPGAVPHADGERGTRMALDRLARLPEER
ncbi:hypothetical protein [Streptomyces sp. AM6-12]|uniref:hypothetical protein n=1 Tax=Streptomyces sp. AM6-12 TaxID=3345149 RepID=UPI0037B45948